MDAPRDVLDEITKEYESTLTLPDTKPSPQWMLMPVGSIGSGKTTVVKLLADRLGLLRISTDEIRKRLKERGYGYGGCRETSYDLSSKYLSLGYSIAIDGNTGSTTGLDYNAKAREKFPSVRQVFIRVAPPDDFILKNLFNPDRTWLYRDHEHAVQTFLKNKQEFAAPDLPYAYTFDPSRKDFEEQIDAGVEALKEALC